jgi:hypothetical protein
VAAGRSGFGAIGEAHWRGRRKLGVRRIRTPIQIDVRMWPAGRGSGF